MFLRAVGYAGRGAGCAHVLALLGRSGLDLGLVLFVLRRSLRRVIALLMRVGLRRVGRLRLGVLTIGLVSIMRLFLSSLSLLVVRSAAVSASASSSVPAQGCRVQVRCGCGRRGVSCVRRRFVDYGADAVRLTGRVGHGIAILRFLCTCGRVGGRSVAIAACVLVLGPVLGAWDTPSCASVAPCGRSLCVGAGGPFLRVLAGLLVSVVRLLLNILLLLLHVLLCWIELLFLGWIVMSRLRVARLQRDFYYCLPNYFTSSNPRSPRTALPPPPACPTPPSPRSQHPSPAPRPL